MFTAGPQLFGIKPKVIAISQRFLEDKPGLLQVAAARQTFDVPE